MTAIGLHVNKGNTMNNDHKVYEDYNVKGDQIWKVKTGGRRGDVVTICRTPEAAQEMADKLNRDPWHLDRGQTRADRIRAMDANNEN
jgi:hypothetical protein